MNDTRFSPAFLSESTAQGAGAGQGGTGAHGCGTCPLCAAPLARPSGHSALYDLQAANVRLHTENILLRHALYQLTGSESEVW